MSIMAKLKKNSKVSDSEVLATSKFFTESDMVPTDVPMINVALSGSLDGGITPGLTVLAGPSKHFKTSFALMMAAAYLKHKPESVVLFYDSEFGSPQTYFETFGIDASRVLHTPISNVEELKFDVIHQLENLERTDDVIVLIDSIGNLASKKELEDALDEKSVADMTRAKALKGLFRMVTPYLSKKNIPMIAINHTYKTMELYSRDVVSGGCLVAGTKIKTPEGDVNIENVSVGDQVTHKSGVIEVTHTWDPETLDEGNPECYEIEFEDGHIVTCSENHLFLVDGVWTRADALTFGDDCEVHKT